MENLSRRAFLTIAATGVATSALAANPLIALADPTSAEVQAQADSVATKLNDMQQQLNVALNDYYAALDAHDAAVAAMDDAQARADAAEAQRSELVDHLGTRATSMYKNGSSSLIDVLLGATSFEDFASSWDFLNSMNAADAASAEQAQAARDEAQAARDEYAAQEKVAADELAKAEQIKSDAEALTAQYQAEYDSLSAEAAQLVAQEQAAAAAAAAQQAAQQALDSGGSYQYSGYVPPVDGSVASIVVAAAYTQLGVPYVWGGTAPYSGLDCSGLTQYCYRQAGIEIGRTTYNQIYSGTIIPVSQAQAGDLLFPTSDSPWHVGLYIGDGQYIHAPYTGAVVQIGQMPGQWTCAVRVG